MIAATWFIAGLVVGVGGALVIGAVLVGRRG
jgi:hypothetical protein